MYHYQQSIIPLHSRRMKCIQCKDFKVQIPVTLNQLIPKDLVVFGIEF